MSSDKVSEGDSIAGGWGALDGVLLIVVLAIVFLGALIPIDGVLSGWAVQFREEHLGGDIVRELGALQQYGQGAVTILVAWAIWLQQPTLRRRLLDWLLAIGIASAVGYPLKMLIGRPRPKFADPEHFLGPFGVYPVSESVGVRHAWEIGSGISSDLWSMPSSHTLFAALMSSMLWVWYPRLRPIAVVMVLLVGSARVLFAAHYPSDVLVGGALGLLIGVPVARRHLGVRWMDWVWCRLIDRKARPALPALLEAERVSRTGRQNGSARRG